MPSHEVNYFLFTVVDCQVTRKQHDRHNCSVQVRCVVKLENIAEWQVTLSGEHVPPEISLPSPEKLRMPEHSKETCISRLIGGKKISTPMDVFTEVSTEEAVQATRTVSYERVKSLVKNIKYNRKFEKGPWTGVDSIIPQLMEQGYVLHYQHVKGAANPKLEPYVLVLSSPFLLKKAAMYPHVWGADCKL